MCQTIWIARHGNREDFIDKNWKHTAKRPFDPGLSPDGIVQAQELGKRLKEENISHIFSSPFLRAVQTANCVAEAIDLSIKIELGIGEYLNPKWFSELPALYPPSELCNQFPRVDCSYQSAFIPKYPEKITDVAHRTSQVIHKILSEIHEDILFVGHGASVYWLTHALIEDLGEMESPLCSIIKIIKHQDKWKLELRSDVSHLTQTEKIIRLN